MSNTHNNQKAILTEGSEVNKDKGYAGSSMLDANNFKNARSYEGTRQSETQYYTKVVNKNIRRKASEKDSETSKLKQTK